MSVSKGQEAVRFSVAPSFFPLTSFPISEQVAIMVPFLYPRKNQTKPRLPHSQAFEHSTKHTRHSSSDSEASTTTTTSTDAHPGAADLDTYTHSLHHWTLYQLRASVPHTTRSLSHETSHTTASATPTIVSPLYPTNSSLYNMPRLSSASGSRSSREGDTGYGEEVLGDVGETPCNTPRSRGLRRRSTVVAANKGRLRVKEEVCDEGEGQARLRPVELVRSLSCGG